MTSRSMKTWLAAMAVVFLAALFIYLARPEPGEPVRAVEVAQETLVSSLTTNGKVEATEGREMRAQAPGFVRSVLIKEGDSVRAGQLLAEMEPGATESQVVRAQAEVEAARADWQMVAQGGSAAESQETQHKLHEARATRDEAAALLEVNERLLKRNAIPRADVEQGREKLKQAERQVAYLESLPAKRFGKEDRERAAARLKSADAALLYAREQLAAARVTAPRHGAVYSLPVRPGNYLNTGEVIARIGTLDRVRVRVFVDEPELGRLAPGQKVRVTWTALPGLHWDGAVERLPAEVTMLGTRSVGEVICTIGNEQRRLLPNVNVDVEIISAVRSNVLTLPKEAVVHAAGPAAEAPNGRFVFVIEDGVVHRRSVEVGISSATRFEILSGVRAGQKVAVPGDRRLEEGMKVKVVA